MTSSGERLSRLELGLILVIAALPRLLGLSHVSMWLDEILGTLRASQGLADAWQSWRADPVHPPLYEFLQWFWFRLVEPEPLRRWLPVAFGLLTVGLLAQLTCRWFGRRAAWATALIAAWSPVHVRYSQELRMYALGLLALILALAASEWALERRHWIGWTTLGLALSLCYWSLYLTAVVLVPVALNIVQARVHRSTRRELSGFALALAVSAVLFLPWLSVVERAATKVHEQQATRWTWSLLGQRWQFLTVGGVEGAALSTVAVLFAFLVVVGIVVALRNAHGRTVVAGALAGSVGVEIILWLADHWTNGRYNLVAWPFLVMLAGLGIARIYDLARGLFPASLRHLSVAVAALPLLAVVVGEAFGIVDYYRHGRADWQRVARAAAALAPPDRPVWVSNDWTQISLGYYLARLEGTTGISSRPRVVATNATPDDLAAESCAVLVAGGWSGSPAMERLLLETPAQRDFPRSGARVAAVGSSSHGPWACWREEDEGDFGERLAPRLLRSDSFRLWRLGRLELSAEEQPFLRFGWSYPERAAGGMTYRWAVGRWAAIDLPARKARVLRLEAWSLSDPQTVVVYRGRQLLASLPLSTIRQELDVALPADFGTAGDEIVTLGFARYASPQENLRPLAVAFDRIVLMP